MKVTFDKEANAAYIYVKDEVREGEAVKTIQINQDIILDFDKEEKLLGIEILNATKNLSKDFLSKIIMKNLVRE